MMDDSNNDILFALSSDEVGAAWEGPVVVRSIRGDNLSMDSDPDSGFPSIAFSDHAVKFVRATDERGNSWGEPHIIGPRRELQRSRSPSSSSTRTETST